jgi:polar amino acid transport system permease protein
MLGPGQQFGRRAPPRVSRRPGLLKGCAGLTLAYVTFFRGTPLFVQILLVHFALMPALVHPTTACCWPATRRAQFRQEHGAFFSGCVALTLNAGAYISEIFRAGIQSIHRGQTQAAYSVGLTHAQAMRYVVLPQAFRRMVPALVNEGVTLIKDSSLVSAIGLAELALAARTVAGAYSRYWEPYLAISALYLMLTLLLSTLAKRLELRRTCAGHGTGEQRLAHRLQGHRRSGRRPEGRLCAGTRLQP